MRFIYGYKEDVARTQHQNVVLIIYYPATGGTVGEGRLPERQMDIQKEKKCSLHGLLFPE